MTNRIPTANGHQGWWQGPAIPCSLDHDLSHRTSPTWAISHLPCLNHLLTSPLWPSPLLLARTISSSPSLDLLSPLRFGPSPLYCTHPSLPRQCWGASRALPIPLFWLISWDKVSLRYGGYWDGKPVSIGLANAMSTVSVTLPVPFLPS